MEFDSPINDNGSTHINIHVATNFTCKYTITESKSHTSPPDDNPDLKAYVAGLASHFEEYSAKWLSRPVNAILFIKRISNNWNFGTNEPYMGSLKSLLTEQTWCPEQIQILPHNYQIVWRLVSAEYMPHPISGQDDYTIPFIQTDEPLQIDPSLRSRSKKMLRKLRVQLAIAKWKMAELTKAYYEKYGEAEDEDSGSALSSELNSDIE